MLRPFARAPHVKIYRDPPAFRGGPPLLRTAPTPGVCDGPARHFQITFNFILTGTVLAR
jgi:hypothetical protein